MKICMNENNNNNGIGFTGFLTILFVAFKLLNIITWSWWWVLSPIWVSIIICILLFLLILWAKN